MGSTTAPTIRWTSLQSTVLALFVEATKPYFNVGCASKKTRSSARQVTRFEVKDRATLISYCILAKLPRRQSHHLVKSTNYYGDHRGHRETHLDQRHTLRLMDKPRQGPLRQGRKCFKKSIIHLSCELLWNMATVFCS